MIFKNNVNLGAAFDRLKAGFLESERLWNDEQTTPHPADRMRKAYATLFAVVKVELGEVELDEPVLATEPVNVVIRNQVPSVNYTRPDEM